MKTILLLFIFISFCLLGCNKSVDSSGNPDFVKQSGGCRSGGFMKVGGAGDSCFTYQFNDVLTVDFCVSGNCCPDSNRFTTHHEIRNDTIEVVVADTAAHLCKCICTYHLYGEFHTLPLTQYIFQVKREDSSSQEILYSEVVKK